MSKSVTEIIGAGAVGINLEDGNHDASVPMRDIGEAASRIRAARDAAREAGIPIVINARIDLYLKQVGDPVSRFSETVRRAEAYLAAGADCVFPFRPYRCRPHRQTNSAIKAPLNIVGRAGTPDVATLERLGVRRRLDRFPSLTMMAIEETKRVAQELRQHGNFDILNYKLKRPTSKNSSMEPNDESKIGFPQSVPRGHEGDGGRQLLSFIVAVSIRLFWS